MVTFSNNKYNCTDGTNVLYFDPGENDFRFVVEAPGIRESFGDLEEVVTFLRAKDLFTEKLIDDLRFKVEEYDGIHKKVMEKYKEFSMSIQTVLCDKFIDILKQADHSPDNKRIITQRISDAEEELYRQLDSDTARKRQVIHNQAAVAHLFHRALIDANTDSSTHKFAKLFLQSIEADRGGEF